jgi:hypothetical protein
MAGGVVMARLLLRVWNRRDTATSLASLRFFVSSTFWTNVSRRDDLDRCVPGTPRIRVQ